MTPPSASSAAGTQGGIGNGAKSGCGSIRRYQSAGWAAISAPRDGSGRRARPSGATTVSPCSAACAAWRVGSPAPAPRRGGAPRRGRRVPRPRLEGRVLARVVPVAVRRDDEGQPPAARLELAGDPGQARDRRVDRDRLARARVRDQVDVRLQRPDDPRHQLHRQRGSQVTMPVVIGTCGARPTLPSGCATSRAARARARGPRPSRSRARRRAGSAASRPARRASGTPRAGRATRTSRGSRPRARSRSRNASSAGSSTRASPWTGGQKAWAGADGWRSARMATQRRPAAASIASRNGPIASTS